MRQITFRALIASMFALTLIASNAKAQIDPTYQINWPLLTGSASTPTQTCQSTYPPPSGDASYGQYYLTTGSNVLFVCTSPGKWQSVGIATATIPLPTASTTTNQPLLVTNAASATDCTTGGGSTITLCVSNGTNYQTLVSGSGTNLPANAPLISTLNNGTSPITLSTGVSLNIDPQNQASSEDTLSGFNGIRCWGDSIWANPMIGLAGKSICINFAQDVAGGVYQDVATPGDDSGDLASRVLVYDSAPKDTGNPVNVGDLGTNNARQTTYQSASAIACTSGTCTVQATNAYTLGEEVCPYGFTSTTGLKVNYTTIGSCVVVTNPLNSSEWSFASSVTGSATDAGFSTPYSYLQGFVQQMEAAISWNATSSTDKYLPVTTPSEFSETGTWTTRQEYYQFNGFGFPGTGYLVNDVISGVCTGGSGPVYKVSAVADYTPINATAWSTDGAGNGTFTVSQTYVTSEYIIFGETTPFVTGAFLNGQVGIITSRTGTSITVSGLTGAAASATEVGSTQPHNTINFAYLQTPAIGCTNITSGVMGTNTGPLSTTYTTTGGTGNGATMNVSIGTTQPLESSTSGDTLTTTVGIYVPPSGEVDLVYSQWGSGVSTGTFEVQDTTGTPVTLTDLNTGSSTLTAQYAGLPPANLDPSAASSALARFTGLTAGTLRQFTITQLSSGLIGIVGYQVPPVLHYRGSAGPNHIWAGIIPQQYNAQGPQTALYNYVGLHNVIQPLAAVGLNVVFADDSNIDPYRDLIATIPLSLTGCVFNGTSAVVSFSGSQLLFVGWTGTISGFSGSCSSLNGAVTLTAFTTNSFTVASATSSGTYTDTGTLTFASNNMALGCQVNTVPPYHPDSCGLDHIVKNVEAASKIFGLGTGSLQIGSNIIANIASTGAQLGMFANGSSLASTSAFNPMYAPYCLNFASAGGNCAFWSLTSPSGVTQYGSVSPTFISQFGVPTGWGIGFGQYTTGTAMTAQSQITNKITFLNGTIYVGAAAAATSSSNPASGGYELMTCQWNGSANVCSTGSTNGFKNTLTASASGSTASPEVLNQFNTQTLTGDPEWALYTNSNGGWLYDLGANSNSFRVTMSPPTVNSTLHAPAGSSGGYPMTASLSTTAATSDTVTVTGMTSTGHCSLTPTNSSAATNLATTYISAKTSNQITVTHVATASMTFDVVCNWY